MKRLVLTISSCLLALCANAQVPAVLGVWELNVEASTLPEGPMQGGAASERRSYIQREDGYLSVLAIRTFGNGVPDFIYIAAKSDGQDYPQYQSQPLAELSINGTPSPYTYSETITDEHTADIIAKFNGQVVNRGTRTISADGRTMTLNVRTFPPGGEELPPFVLVFDKQGE